MKLYLASSWRNAYYPEVLAALRRAGHVVYDFRNPPGGTGFSWSKIRAEPIADADSLREVLAHPIAQDGFNSDRRAMGWADACVILLPCGNSAHLEAGWFTGRGKPVAVLAPELREPELMYKLADVEGDGPGLTPIFATADEVLAHLAGVVVERGCTRAGRLKEERDAATARAERAEDALRLIAEADPVKLTRSEHLDEWVEAEAFSECQVIAMTALGMPVDRDEVVG